MAASLIDIQLSNNMAGRAGPPRGMKIGVRAANGPLVPAYPVLKTLRVGKRGPCAFLYSVEKEHFRIADDGKSQDQHRGCLGEYFRGKERFRISDDGKAQDRVCGGLGFLLCAVPGGLIGARFRQIRYRIFR